MCVFFFLSNIETPASDNELLFTYLSLTVLLPWYLAALRQQQSFVVYLYRASLFIKNSVGGAGLSTGEPTGCRVSSSCAKWGSLLPYAFRQRRGGAETKTRPSGIATELQASKSSPQKTLHAHRVPRQTCCISDSLEAFCTPFRMTQRPKKQKKKIVKHLHGDWIK